MAMVADLDPRSDLPLHRQVYESIRTDILAGRLRSGDRLPPTRTLAGMLSLSRTTVSEAYDQLAAEGYIQSRQGSGTFVASDLPEERLRGSTESAERAQQRARPRLSAWGDRVTAGEYHALLRDGDAAPLPFDFRPGAIAPDQFPWEAWEESVKRALAHDRTRLLAYPPSAGHPALRAAIAAHVARYRAVRCTPEQVVVVNGTQQGLNLLVHLLLEAGDRVAVEDPGYPAARLALEARGLDVRRVPVNAEGMAIDALAESGPYRLVHVTPSHQDPTGATMSLSRRLALLEEAQRTGCLVFEDDYDSEFRYEGRPVESLQGLDRAGLVVYAGTFSKSVLAGLRIGFLVLPPPLVGPFIAGKSLWDAGAPMLEQAALAQFMQSGGYERHIRRMRRVYRSRRDALVNALNARFGEDVTVGERHGGLNVLVALNVPEREEALAEKAAAAGVGLRPAAPYFAHPPERPVFLMGFAGLTEDEIGRGIDRLAEAIGYRRRAARTQT